MRRPGDVIVFPRTSVSAVLVRHSLGAWEAIITEDPNGNHPQGLTVRLREDQLGSSVKGRVVADVG